MNLCPVEIIDLTDVLLPQQISAWEVVACTEEGTFSKTCYQRDIAEFWQKMWTDDPPTRRVPEGVHVLMHFEPYGEEGEVWGVYRSVEGAKAAVAQFDPIWEEEGEKIITVGDRRSPWFEIKRYTVE